MDDVAQVEEVGYSIQIGFPYRLNFQAGDIIDFDISGTVTFGELNRSLTLGSEFAVGNERCQSLPRPARLAGEDGDQCLLLLFRGGITNVKQGGPVAVNHHRYLQPAQPDFAACSPLPALC